MRRRALAGQGSVYREAGRRTRWVAEITVTLANGTKQRVRARGRTADEAQLARDARVDRVLADQPAAGKLTVREVSERWLAARAHALKASTIATYRKSLDAYALPRLGGALVTRVTPLDVQDVIDGVLARATERDDMRAAADRCRRVLSALFAQAVAWDLTSVNPVDRVPRVRPRERERGYWTRDEVARFLASAHGTAYYPLFLTAVTTGMRMGELLALRWADVDARGVTVRRTYSSDARGISDAPKSAAGRRRVPIPPEVRRALGPAGPADELMFRSRAGGMLTPSSVRRALDRVTARAGVVRLRFHDLRRTYASLLASEGHHPSVIQRLLGHASPDLAMRVYTSVSRDTLEAAIVRPPIPLEGAPSARTDRGGGGGLVGGQRGGLGASQGDRKRAKVTPGDGGEPASRTVRVPRGARARKRAPRNS